MSRSTAKLSAQPSRGPGGDVSASSSDGQTAVTVEPGAARHRQSRLIRNTIFNLAGESTPILAALFAVPVLVRTLGTNRFGLLTIAWMVIGYFSLFDLGLGRALTQLVAEKRGAGHDEDIPTLIWTALLIMFMLGVVGTIVIGSIAHVLVYRVLKMPETLRPETVRAFYVLALSIPIVISSIGLRGVLEALHRFDLTNAVRTPMGVFTFVGPLLVLPFSSSLVPVVAVLAVGRLITCAVYGALCLRVLPALRHSIAVQVLAIRPLFRFGSWMTVSNVVSPIM